jgi:N-acetylmuramoyl-L-alanine amidase
MTNSVMERPAQPERPPRRAKKPQPLSPSGTSSQARRQAAAILEVLAGARTPADAARALGVSLPRYYLLEEKALAVELAPGPNGVADLPSANYQQRAAAAIADGVASMRDRLGAQP